MSTWFTLVMLLGIGILTYLWAKHADERGM